MAIKFLHNISVSAEEIKDNSSSTLNYPPYLQRKIDYRIMTVLCGSYFLQFLDKNLLNYAGVMGIKKNLEGNDFANLGTMFYGAYIFAEPITGYLLQVLPTCKLLSFCIIAWGVVVACHAACESYASLMIVRTLLGVFESSLSPGLIVISSMYWNKSENLKRTGIWVAFAGLSVIIGGVLSFGFQYVENQHFASWKIFFLVMGLVTVLFGLLTLVILPDNPTNAKFLTEEEKLIVLEHIRNNQTGTESKKFKFDQVKELVFRDKHTWPLFLLTTVSMISTGALGTWSVTIIQSFGFSSKVSSLVQMPVGAAMCIAILSETYICSKIGHRTLIFSVMCLPAIAGYVMLLKCENKVAKLIAIYMNMGSTGVIALLYSWNSANTAGHTKKLARNGLTMIAFSLGSLIGPQLFRSNEAPHYKTALIVLIITSILCIPLAALVGFISKWENDKRDRQPAQELPKNYEFRDLTDIENPNFRYQY